MFSSDVIERPRFSGSQSGSLPRQDLLREVPDHVRQRLAAVSIRRRAEAGSELSLGDGSIDSVCFIEEGVASLVGTVGENQGEVGLVGSGGMVGSLSLVLGGRRACSAIAQTDCVFSDVDADTVKHLMEQEPELREAVTNYAADLMQQLVRVSVCHSSHSLLQRVAGWIEAVDAHLRDGTIGITHRQIANLVCARRATVTEILHVLEGEGAIRSRRGSLSVRDRTVLAGMACGCRRPHPH